MVEATLGSASARCAKCGGDLAAAALACAGCGRLVHAETLQRLAATAREREAGGDGAGALAAWREALDLLPVGTRQHEVVSATIARGREALESRPTPAPTEPSWIRRAGPIGIAAFGVWKLLGLTKLASFLSLFASFALYWTSWGWQFAAGFCAAIYLHELGHVFALRRAGIPASAPMFIPGLGAYVRMHRAPPDARTDAFVGLAGPIAGLAVAAASYAIALATGSGLALALAHSGALLNLFNLIPLWSLDGARGFAPLSRGERLAVVVACGVALALTHEGLLWLLLIPGVVVAFSPRAPKSGNPLVAALFVGLMAALVVIAWSTRP